MKRWLLSVGTVLLPRLLPRLLPGLLPGLLLGLLPTLAAALEPADFARARVIQSPNPDSPPGLVQRLVIPQDVYEWTTRSDLGDLRLFDAAHQSLPYALRRPSPAPDHTPWRALPVFLLPMPAADGRETAVNIQLGDDGTVIAVQGGQPAAPDHAAYLVDASALSQSFTEVALTWPPDQPDFVSELLLETSDDLGRWRPLTRATVAKLTAPSEAGERVVSNRFDVPPSRARYLRLSWRNAATAPRVAGLEVRRLLPGSPRRDWKTLSGRPVDSAYEFDTGGSFPVDRVRVTPPRATFLADARVWSRAGSAEPWQDRGVHRFYRVALEGADGPTVASEPAALDVYQHRHWRVRWIDGETTPPALEVGWLPDELIYLRQGEAPFLMAYGRAGVPAQQWPMADLASRLGADAALDTLTVSALGEPRTLGGAASLEPAARPIDRRQVALWAVLLAGVALVAALAYRLVR